MKVVIPVLLLLVAVAIAGTAAWFYLAWSFRGGGSDVPMEQRPLPPFTRIVVEGFADVMLVQGAAEAVSVESPARLPVRLRADVSDGTLTISHDPARRWWSGFFGAGGRPARITITFRELEAIGATGRSRSAPRGSRPNGSGSRRPERRRSRSRGSTPRS